MNIGELIATIGADTTKFDQALTRTENRLKSAGKSMQKAGRQMSMAVTAPLVAVGALGLRTAANFESAMNKVKAVSGATGDEFKQLEGIARELGASTKFSATEAAEGMNFLAMAGFDVKEIMQAMPATLNLAAAGNMQLAESADIVSNIMQGFGLEASQTGETVDILTKTFTSSNTSLTQLGEAMSYVAPAARAFGQDITMTSAAVGILSDAGIQASKAGTGLRQAFIQLQKKSDDLGISVTDTNGKMLPLVNILENIEKSGLTTAEVINTVGPRAGTALAALIDRGPQALSDFTTELNNAGGTAKQVADTQMEGLNGALTELRSALNEVAISFSEHFMGSIEALADSVTDFTRWLGNLDKETKKLVVTIGGIAAAIGPVLVILGTLSATVIPALISGFTLLTGPVGLVVLGLGALTAGIMEFNNAANRGNQILNETKEAISEANAEYNTQKNRVDDLVDSLITLNQKENLSSAEIRAKKDIIDELNNNYGQYLDNQVNEKTSLEDLRDIQKQVNDGLRQNILIKAQQSQLEKIQTDRLNAQQQSYKELDNILQGLGIESIARRAELIGEAFEKGADGGAELFDIIDKKTGPLSSKMAKANCAVVEFVRAERGAIKATELLNSQFEALGGTAEKTSDTVKSTATDFGKQFEVAANNASKLIDDIDGEMSLDVDDIPIQKWAGAVQDSLPSFYELKAAFNECGQAACDLIDNMSELNLSVDNIPAEKFVSKADRMAESMLRAAGQIKWAINNAAVNVVSGTAEMIGQMAVGATSIGDIGNMIFGTLADLAIRVGKIAIGVGIAIEGIKKSLQSLNPVLAVAAGIALIALGGVVKSKLNQAANPEGGGLQGLATGGEVVRSGNFLVGEQGPEMVNLPRGAAVTPNHMLSSMEGETKRELVATVRGSQLDFILNEWYKRKDKVT